MDSTTSSFLSISPSSGPLEINCVGRDAPSCERCLDFRSNTGRYILSCLLLTSGLIPAIIVVSDNARSVSQAVPMVEENDDLQARLRCGSVVHATIRELQLERGLSAYYFTSGKLTQVRDAMLEQRVKVEYSVSQWSSALGSGGILCWQDTDGAIKTMKENTTYFRHHVDTSSIDAYGVINSYTSMLTTILKPNKLLMMEASLGPIWQIVVSMTDVASAVEHAGLQRALGTIFFAKQDFDRFALQEFVVNSLLSNTLMAEAEEFSEIIRNFRARDDVQSTLQKVAEFSELIEKNTTETNATSYLEMASWWLGNMTAYIELLNTLQDELAADLELQTSNWSIRLRRTTLIGAVLLCTEFLFYPLFAMLSIKLMRSIKDHSKELSSRLKNLIKEQRRNTALINEMYPPSVAARLIKGQEVAPETFESASVCFVQLADFDDLTKRIPGGFMVYFINHLFELIDTEACKHDVFKVETIGDQYVAVSGLPRRNGDSHVSELANLALGLLDSTRRIDVDHLTNRKISLQIGISTGMVVAGIVGLKMPRYCLFGDTVNMASRMQSSGQ
ncbi:receptor-type guanylate cyclase gcy-13, partial [Plakobranchus ocellatus]